MKTKSLMIAIALFALVMGMTVAADAGTYARTLTIGTSAGSLNSTVTLPITLGGDTGGQVGGVAFTLTYDTTKLQFVAFSQATTTFLDPTTFSDGAGGYSNPYTSPNSKPQSSIFYQVNSDTASGTVKIAAASAVAISNAVIFNVQFKVIATFTGSQAITLTQTVLSTNTSAGYTETANPIPVVVGMPSSTADNNGYYPTVDTFTTTLASGSITFSTFSKGDVSGDGKLNSTDALYILQFLAGNISSLSGADGDINKDGKKNSTDALYILQFLAGNITTLP